MIKPHIFIKLIHHQTDKRNGQRCLFNKTTKKSRIMSGIIKTRSKDILWHLSVGVRKEKKKDSTTAQVFNKFN